MTPAEATGAARGRAARWGLWLGPLAGAAAYALLPHAYVGESGALETLGHSGRLVGALGVWMATWWLTEALPLPATALLPIAVLPTLGGSGVREAAEPYAAPVVFLFLGGFLMALSMQRWGLDRRIALWTLRLVGSTPRGLVGGIMVVTAVLSACVSNTATVTVMLPIGLGAAELCRTTSELDDAATARLHRCVLLGMAYAASIGGMATIIGSPPNGVVVAYIERQLDVRISFVRWLTLGLPLVALLLPTAWWLLTRVLEPVPRAEIPGGRRFLERELERLGPPRAGEWVTFAVFCTAATAWVLRPLLNRVLPGLTDPGIAIAAAVVLFAVPAGRGRGAILTWESAQSVPWGILILFGGGLSLAGAVDASGLAAYLGSRATSLAGLGPLTATATVTGATVFLTELTSNTATANTLVPLLTALAPGLGLHPFALILPAALAASCAFMLPVATPPNAIVFGSGKLPLGSMMRAGLWMNLIAIAVITGVLHFWILPAWIE